MVLSTEEWKLIANYHDKINKKAFLVYCMMLETLLVIVMVSIRKPSYASLGVGFWFYIIHYLCSLIYLCWLRKKDQALLEKYRVVGAELALTLQSWMKKVVNNVEEEADQPADDLINCYCYIATIPLCSILNTLIYFAALYGIFGIGLCGKYYWSAHTLRIYNMVAAVAFNVIVLGRCYYYYWRKEKLPVLGLECPPVV